MIDRIALAEELEKAAIEYPGRGLSGVVPIRIVLRNAVVAALRSPPANETAGLREITEDLVMDAIRKSKLVDVLTVPSWKDGIDINKPTYRAMEFAKLLVAALATAPQGQKMPKAGVYFDTWATNPVGSSAPRDAPAGAVREQIARIIDPDAEWGKILETGSDANNQILLALEKADLILAALPASARVEGDLEEIARVIDPGAMKLYDKYKGTDLQLPFGTSCRVNDALTRADAILALSRPNRTTPENKGDRQP